MRKRTRERPGRSGIERTEWQDGRSLAPADGGRGAPGSAGGAGLDAPPADWNLIREAVARIEARLSAASAWAHVQGGGRLAAALVSLGEAVADARFILALETTACDCDACVSE